LQLDFRLFLQPFLVGFLRIASLYFFILFYFIFYFFWEKNEFWGITQNWVMTVGMGGSLQFERGQLGWGRRRRNRGRE